MTTDAPGSLAAFLTDSPFPEYLERCWSGTHYLNFPVESGSAAYDPGGINAHVLFYLIYAEMLGKSRAPQGRAAQLTGWLAEQVRADGLCLTDGGVTDHPAYASTLGDALGTAVFYAERIGLDPEGARTARAALQRIAELHPRIRYPEGAQGKTQQLRFELRVYYWMSLLSTDPVWKERFQVCFANGLTNYVSPAAIDGPLLQPSLNPDWTWNYVSGGGITDRHSTNTHTPAYYCTEPNGFMFVYLHALRNGVMKREESIDRFCANFIQGLPRNMSRGGHLASDLDGYGIHRAWYGPCLVEGIPLESAALAALLGMEDSAGLLRWFIGRYMEFVRQSPSYSATGLPVAQPFGHQINIEDQFSQLACARFYGSIARALYEFGDIETAAPEPPAFASYAWEAEWLRVSTPHYETSLAGYTCLRNIPVVPKYGDPNLGTLIGGAPLATLFSRGELLYAASFPAAALWHIEVEDHNGRKFVSCSTSPDDETSFAVSTSETGILTREDFNPYDPPCNLSFGEAGQIEAVWRRREKKYMLDFGIHNRYREESIDLEFSVRHEAGHYCDRITFILPIPNLNAEFHDGNGWHKLETLSALPKAVRWGTSSRCTAELELCGDAGNEVTVTTEALPELPGMPGGANSFSPHPTTQVRIAIVPGVRARVHRLHCHLKFQ